MINRYQCLSDNQNNIYTKKLMSLSRYAQLVTLTNINAQSTTWSMIFARQIINDVDQQLLFGMIAQFALR